MLSHVVIRMRLCSYNKVVVGILSRRLYVTLPEKGRQYVSELNKRTQAVLPVALELLQTTRYKVESIKQHTKYLESEFERARQDLSEATKVLDKTKTDLQDLYFRRELEYRKTKSDVRVIREINEEENVLKEREEKEQSKVDEFLKRETELFESTRSSNETLYKTARNYANRFIVLGISIGTVLSLWKAYRYFKPHDVMFPNDPTNMSALVDGVRRLDTCNESLTNSVLYEVKSQSQCLKDVQKDQEITLKGVKDILSALQSQTKFLENISSSKESHEIYSDIKDLQNEVRDNTKLLKESLHQRDIWSSNNNVFSSDFVLTVSIAITAGIVSATIPVVGYLVYLYR